MEFIIGSCYGQTMKLARLLAASALALGGCTAPAPVAPVPPNNTGTATAPTAPRPITSIDDFDYTAEFAGAVRIGGGMDDVIAEFGEPASVTDVEAMEATGEWVRTYSWESLGLSVIVAAENSEGPFAIVSLMLGEGSNLRTIRDIGVGSTRAEVEAAYRPAINLEESEDATIVVGSVYGGIMFEIDAGASRVVSIFVGAAAE